MKSNTEAIAQYTSTLSRRRRASNRYASRLCVLAAAATSASAALITVPASAAGQVIPNGSWGASTFSASGKVNGTDSTVCSQGIATLTSSVSGDSLSFSFVGISVQIITGSGPQSSFYQASVDGTGGPIGIYSAQDACGVSFSQNGLGNSSHVLNLSLVQAGPVDVIAFRYDDGRPASSTTTPATTSTGTSKGGGSKSQDDGGSNTGAIVGGVVGGIAAGLALAGLATYCYMRNRRRKYDPASRYPNDQELFATPYASTQGLQSTGRATQTTSYYNDATSYYPSESGRGGRGWGGSHVGGGSLAGGGWGGSHTGGPPGGYPTSSTSGSSVPRTTGGTSALHEDDLQRIAEHVTSMMAGGAAGQGYGQARSGYSGSSMSYNGPEPTPTSTAPTQRSEKAEYIRRQQGSDGTAVNRLPDRSQQTPEEPPPAY